MEANDPRQVVDSDRVVSHRPPLSRRTFLKAGALATGTAVVATATAMPASAEELVPASKDELPELHADDWAMLIDLTRCVGCGKCVRACKLNNDLEWLQQQPSTGSEAVLASSNWTVVRTANVETTQETRIGPRDRLTRRYVKAQCMHCLEPACTSACFVKALHKTEAGPVVYDVDRCVGCRYCLMACPFGIPTFEWDVAFGNIQKCDFCPEFTLHGEPTACQQACPYEALAFGRRREMLAEAWRRIDAEPRYVRHVYGEHEAGGTSVLYVSDVSFGELGLPTEMPGDPLPTYTWEVARVLPPFAAGFSMSIVALWARRQRVLRERDEISEEVTTG